MHANDLWLLGYPFRQETVQRTGIAGKSVEFLGKIVCVLIVRHGRTSLSLIALCMQISRLREEAA